jgi:hypothetical protein
MFEIEVATFLSSVSDEQADYECEPDSFTVLEDSFEDHRDNMSKIKKR